MLMEKYNGPRPRRQARTLPSFNKPLNLQLVRTSQSACVGAAGTSRVYASYSTSAADLAALSQQPSVAMVLGSSCAFGQWGSTYSGASANGTYWGDVGARAAAAVRAGAVGVLFGEGQPGKIPEQLLSDYFSAPLCMLSNADAVSLAASLTAAGGAASADFTNTVLYTSLDDALPGSSLTTLSVPGIWSPTPAVLATFNPSASPAVSAPLVAVAVSPLCLWPASSANNFSQCLPCWQAHATGGAAAIFQVANGSTSVSGAVAFINWGSSSEPTCFGWYWPLIFF